MTPEQFGAITTLIRARDPSRAGARMVLVDGMRPADAARAAGITPRAVDNALRRIRAAHALIGSAYGDHSGRTTSRT